MEQEILTMPFIVYEVEAERSDRKNKRLWITVMTLIGLLAALIAAKNDSHRRTQRN